MKIRETTSYILIIVISFIVYFKVLNYSFVWDDLGDVLIKNPYLRHFTLWSLGQIWGNIATGMYIPVTNTVWGLLASISVFFTNNPFDSYIFHLSNVIIHTINSTLVYCLINRLVGKGWFSIVGTLVFNTSTPS